MSLSMNCMPAYTATIPFKGGEITLCSYNKHNKAIYNNANFIFTKTRKMVEMLYDFSFDFNKIINNRLT